MIDAGAVAIVVGVVAMSAVAVGDELAKRWQWADRMLHRALGGDR